MSSPTPAGSTPTPGATTPGTTPGSPSGSSSGSSSGTSSGSPSGSSSGTVPRLVLAWTVVGVPLAYGVFETAKKAAALFTGLPARAGPGLRRIPSTLVLGILRRPGDRPAVRRSVGQRTSTAAARRATVSPTTG